jgi:hypothetical protein
MRPANGSTVTRFGIMWIGNPLRMVQAATDALARLREADRRLTQRRRRRS